MPRLAHAIVVMAALAISGIAAAKSFDEISMEWAQTVFGIDNQAQPRLLPRSASLSFASGVNERLQNSDGYTSTLPTSASASVNGAWASASAGPGYLKAFAASTLANTFTGNVSIARGRFGEVVQVSDEYREYFDPRIGGSTYMVPFEWKGHVEVNFGGADIEHPEFRISFRIQNVEESGPWGLPNTGFDFMVGNLPWTGWGVSPVGMGYQGCFECTWQQVGDKSFRLDFTIWYQAPIGQTFVQWMDMSLMSVNGGLVYANNSFAIDSVSAPTGSFSVDSGVLTYSPEDGAWHYPEPPALAVPEPASAALTLVGLLYLHRRLMKQSAQSLSR